MFAEIIADLPAQAGSYALWLRLGQPQNLAIGKRGDFLFPAGNYVYLGSARGPGGLRARLGRHLRGGGKSHWHIDYLRGLAQVRGFGYVIGDRGKPWLAPTECTWSQKLAALPEAQTPISGFGSSDCTSGCVAHLVFFPFADIEQISTLLNCEVRSLLDA